jgi:RNA polymerase sigma-70 factor (ECF subfamily)
LVERAIQGSAEAYKEIYGLKRRELYLSALRQLGSPEDAEDAVQDTLISAFQHITGLKDPHALNAWLYRILRRRCADIVRRRKRQAPPLMTDESAADMIADEDADFLPEKYTLDAELRAKLAAALSRLPEKSRETLTLYYIKDMKYGEIAAATHTSVKTVSTNLLRAKRKLRSMLGALW